MGFYRKRVFPVLAGLLWIAFLTLDLAGRGDSTWVKFSAICLCCVTALLGARTTDGKLVAAALCFTVAADWFLLVRDDHYELGVGLFIVVQLLYAYRLYLLRGKAVCKWGLALRLAGLALATFPAALPLFYFLNLVVNTAEAFALCLPLRGRCHGEAVTEGVARLFALGLLLFVCCDICVGAYNLNLLPVLSFPGMWFFYLPSQVLIVLSQETGDTNEKAL